jgi:hypothetical protein
MPALHAHPDTPCDAVRAVHARAERAGEGLLQVRYRIEGELARLRIPAPGRRGRRVEAGERLWEHTCCELFVAPAADAAYREYNFSPSGEWAGYAFERYREGARAALPEPGIAVRRDAGGLELEARVAVQPGRLRVALCAVIEDQAGALSYWALRHPAPKPDFHHPGAFALELD